MARRDTAEQRTAQAILYTTYTQKEVDGIAGEIQDLVKKYNRSKMDRMKTGGTKRNEKTRVKMHPPETSSTANTDTVPTPSNRGSGLNGRNEGNKR